MKKYTGSLSDKMIARGIPTVASLAAMTMVSFSQTIPERDEVAALLMQHDAGTRSQVLAQALTNIQEGDAWDTQGAQEFSLSNRFSSEDSGAIGPQRAAYDMGDSLRNDHFDKAYSGPAGKGGGLTIRLDGKGLSAGLGYVSGDKIRQAVSLFELNR